jgi:diguanylate cyclase (GGDEF)-like protein
MNANNPPTFLLASPEPALLAAIEPVLLASGARVEVVLAAEAALAAITVANPPSLALLDAKLPGMEIGQLLAQARGQVSGKRMAIVLISDTVTQEWIDRLAEGVIDDLIPRAAESSYWRLRIDLLLRANRWLHELEVLREAAVLNAQTDRLTGVYNRETMLALLFRETDRVQRMNGSLSMILFDIDDFGHWNSRLGAEACDALLCNVVSRTTRLLRSYDLLGRPGMDEFLIALPGCTTANAGMLAERLRIEVFATPFRVEGESIRLSACFGVASSHGRSPVVVLREAEQALQWAKAEGPESIQFFGDSAQPAPAPVAFLSPSSGDELLAW